MEAERTPVKKRAITLLFTARSFLSALLSNSRSASNCRVLKISRFFFRSICICGRFSHYDNKFSQGNQFDSLLGSPILFHHPAFALSSSRLEKCLLFFCCYCFWPPSGILTPLPGLNSTPSAAKAQSPNYWTSGEFPRQFCCCCCCF